MCERQRQAVTVGGCARGAHCALMRHCSHTHQHKRPLRVNASVERTLCVVCCYVIVFGVFGGGIYLRACHRVSTHILHTHTYMRTRALVRPNLCTVAAAMFSLLQFARGAHATCAICASPLLQHCRCSRWTWRLYSRCGDTGS
jgi:hypothetical protein